MVGESLKTSLCREQAEIMTLVIHKIWNQSVKSSTWCSFWKRANVIPPPEFDMPKDKTEYRGINITPVIARGFQKSEYSIHARDVVEEAFLPSLLTVRPVFHYIRIVVKRSVLLCFMSTLIELMIWTQKKMLCYATIHLKWKTAFRQCKMTQWVLQVMTVCSIKTVPHYSWKGDDW